MPKRLDFALGVATFVASCLMLALPLTVALWPLLRPGPLGLSGGVIEFTAASGIVGGAGLIVGIWLIVKSRAP